jgi:hypothetical protein
MDRSTLNALRAAEQAVTRLVAACRKNGPLYRRHPRAVAQLSRTGKWHLSALAGVLKALDTTDDNDAGNRRGA